MHSESHVEMGIHERNFEEVSTDRRKPVNQLTKRVEYT